MKLGATMGEFAGFEHALWYEGVIPEHLAVRNAVGLFDITHMGRCTVKGVNAGALLDYILTRDISQMKINQGHYTVMCNNHGGIIDDLVVFRLHEDTFFVVYNAGNREKDYKWIHSHAKDFNVQTRDVSDEVAMFAVQGPKALATLQPLSDVDLSDIRRYWGRWMNLNDLEVLLTRTGYTGEDGFEVYLWGTPSEESEKAEKLWGAILKAGEEHGIKPCGLGARDTLRLEAGMCLYGNDINEDTTPLEAKLTFTISFEKDNFIGKDALLKQKDEGLKRTRVGLRMLKRGIPRHGYQIFLDGKEIGQVTSGTFSPLLQRGIGMGYVPPEHAAIGTQVDIKIRKSFLSAEIVKMPFYDTTRYGWRRKT
ncbi:MAG: glycine cleavage system aminomethyltransferase GcvT [Candidatus Heimdallarchaeota archaeon]